MKRIDAHQHFWIYNDTDYTWMGSAHGAIRRDFTPEDLSPLLDSVGFDGSVAVQARQAMEETEFLLSLADRSDRVLGVVGWLDLRSERIADEIATYGANPKLKGVRHVVHDEPDDEFVLRDTFRRGVRALGPAGLTYDLLLFPRHIPAAMRLIDEFPNQPFVVDHIAKPPIKGGETEPWARDIAQLAERPNVTCKLSGMVTEADHASWKPEDLHPYIDVVLEAFGASRLMIGSDWPVCTLAGEYKRVMDVTLEHIARLSSDEQAMITGGTCARFYGIEG